MNRNGRSVPMMSVPRSAAAVGLCLLGALVPLSFAHPFGDPREQRTPSGALLTGADAPESLRKLAGAKCGNCHSEAVKWPVYSHVAPFSWLIERDVVEARRHLNFSRWEMYSRSEKIDLLSRLAAEARSGEMPPARYTAVHPGARLTVIEQRELYEWAKRERRRLRVEGQDIPGIR